jgi:hypothetical protein
LALNLAGIGIEHITSAAGRPCHGLARNKVADLTHGFLRVRRFTPFEWPLPSFEIAQL